MLSWPPNNAPTVAPIAVPITALLTPLISRYCIRSAAAYLSAGILPEIGII